MSRLLPGAHPHRRSTAVGTGKAADLVRSGHRRLRLFSDQEATKARTQAGDTQIEGDRKGAVKKAPGKKPRGWPTAGAKEEC